MAPIVTEQRTEPTAALSETRTPFKHAHCGRRIETRMHLASAPALGIAWCRMPGGRRGESVVGSQASTPLRVRGGHSHGSSASVKSLEGAVPAHSMGNKVGLEKSDKVTGGDCLGGRAHSLCFPTCSLSPTHHP